MEPKSRLPLIYGCAFLIALLVWSTVVGGIAIYKTVEWAMSQPWTPAGGIYNDTDEVLDVVLNGGHVTIMPGQFWNDGRAWLYEQPQRVEARTNDGELVFC